MAELTRNIESLNANLSSSIRGQASSFRSLSSVDSARENDDDEVQLQWAAIERLPTFERLRSSLYDQGNSGESREAKGKRLVDVTKLGAMERHLFIEKLMQNVEEDHRRLLEIMRERIKK